MTNFVKTFCTLLEDLGVQYVFGVSGGPIAHLWSTLENSRMRFIHCRHESGASFAATEAYFATNHPTAVLVTTGPGITNSLTGLFAARVEGAKVLLLSAYTPTAKRGRYPLQETTESCKDIYSENQLFNYAVIVESPAMLPLISQKLRAGFATPSSFVAHISIPIDVQTSPTDLNLSQLSPSKLNSTIVAEEAIVKQCAHLLADAPFAIWVGFGARHAAKEILQLAELTGARVMCTPRGKGIFPENHPQFVGVTGFGGHESVWTYLEENKPKYILVLGSRLSEISSFWDPRLVPPEGFLHVDVDPFVPGVAYPFAKNFTIQAEIKSFVSSLLDQLPKKKIKPRKNSKTYADTQLPSKKSSLIDPATLLEYIQKIIIDDNDALIMVDAGNSYAWATHLLRFDKPNRYRASSMWGSMGHFTTGVIGAALAKKEKVVAIVGDGAMLMNNEINTAVKYGIPAVWIVLNDSCYNMCEQGNSLIGVKADTQIPQTNFVNFARSMGADGIRVEKIDDIAPALHKAMKASLPFVVDVIIDPQAFAPIGARVKSLASQGKKSEQGK